MNQPFTGERFWSDGGTAHWRGPDGRPERLEDAALRRAGRCGPDHHPSRHVRRRPESARLRRAEGARAHDALRRRLLRLLPAGAGFVDLIVEAGLKPYDVVALVPIIEAAGGRITTWEGGPATEGGRIVAAGDARVHKEALAILRAVD